MRTREVLQGTLAIIIMPISATMLFLGMALVPFSASRGWFVCKHMAKNAAFLIPRLPGVLMELWRERAKAEAEDRMSIPMMLVLSIFAMPFIGVMLLLDDYV